jgi:superfamily II DNA or RNA helicase
MLFPELRGNSISFSELLAPSKDIGGASFEKKSPHPHQKEAIKDLVNALSVSGNDVRTQGIMACGTGKTMVALWVAEEMKAQKTLLCEPSLALIAQNLKEWQANARGPRPEILVVCSDETVVKPNQDEVKVDLRDIPARVTSDPKEIAEFLKSKSERKIVMSTYHSLPLIGKAMETRGTGRFDLAIGDEAHRTAAKEEGAFTLFHYQEVIRSRGRLYLTATPKIYEGDSDIKISMDDESIFGKVGHSLPFSKAIERGLLTDYRLVVATLPDNYLGKGKKYETPEMQDTIKQLAVLKAIEKYHLSKVLTFHSSVKRAYGFAESLEINGPKFLPNREIHASGVDGSMSTKTRSELLKLLAERPKKVLSLLSNCRCLTEGIDVQAIDGVVFFDKKNEEIDIVQAIGRAIRQSTSTNKEYGTIIVPLIVPSNVEGAEFLHSSEFSKIAQVMRALRSHDDRFEIKMKDTLSEWTGSERGERKTSESVLFNSEGLSKEFIESLSTKVLKVGAGIRGCVLTEEAILKSARAYHGLHGKLPTAESKEEVPGMPGETWGAIDAAGKIGHRNLTRGRTLFIILEPLRNELGLDKSLSEEAILKSAREHHGLHGKLPTNSSKEEVPGMPGETWGAIDTAGRNGHRDLTKGRSLSIILEPLRKELGLDKGLSEEVILKSAREYHGLHGKLPTNKAHEEVPGMPGETWRAIDAAGRKGHRNLTKGRPLSKILAPLKEELKNKQ